MLAAGAYYDIREHRIPNWWVFAAAIIGIFLCVLESGKPVGTLVFMEETGAFLLRMILVFTIFFLLFLCRMIGAGDIKLAALMCGYLGLKDAAVAIGCGFVIGAFWSFLKMMGKGIFFTRLSYFTAYIRHIYQTKKITAYYCAGRDGYEVVIPLGVCLFLGTVVYIILLR